MSFSLRRTIAVCLLVAAGFAIMRLEWWAFVVVLPAIAAAFVLDPN
jgi:hypothetical protein